MRSRRSRGGGGSAALEVAGSHSRKQNSFDDFAAAARHLIDRKYTSNEKLAFSGESAGALLVGTVAMQHPKLARAVVARSGVFDMLRAEQGATGPFNVPDRGSVTKVNEFHALYAYWPITMSGPRALS